MPPISTRIPTLTSRSAYLTLLFVAVTFSTVAPNALAQCNCGGSNVALPPTAYYPPMPPPMLMGGVPGMEYPGMIPDGQIIEGDTIYLNVTVPEDAILTINGDPTISTGTNRYFVVKGLDIERTYKFVIVAETANAAGVPMEETKTVTLSPGSTEQVALKPVKRKVVKPVVVVPLSADAEDGDEAAEDEEVAGEDADEVLTGNPFSVPVPVSTGASASPKPLVRRIALDSR